MAFPKVVAFDTDWTLWQNVTTNGVWGKGPGAAPKLEDNMYRVDPFTIGDVSSVLDNKVSIKVFGDISRIINDVLKNGAQLAIVARTNKALSDRALYYFNTINPADDKEWSIIHLVKYDEVVDESKTTQFRRIIGYSQSDPMDMIHFEDEAFNNCVRIEAAVTFKLCLDKQGVTWDLYQEGISHWHRVKNLTIRSNPSDPPQRKLIGYSGLSTDWIKRVNVLKEGMIDTEFGYRWGYCLYVTDDIKIARFFRDWEIRLGRESYVNEVWVNDYATWANLNKVWVRENAGDLPQMNSTGWSLEASGQNQEARDRTIESKWGVKTPYVMFSRHYWFQDVPHPKQRFSEMMVYTQIQRALVDVVTLSNARTDELAETNPTPVPFHQQIKEWNITLPQETREEEPTFFNQSI
ncbi:hypothetical protein DXG01_001926 [Tephrocybe rancida]|nr:hypothetical protein DXG01_001926 [Tephrocybe rancida]